MELSRFSDSFNGFPMILFQLAKISSFERTRTSVSQNWPVRRTRRKLFHFRQSVSNFAVRQL